MGYIVRSQYWLMAYCICGAGDVHMLLNMVYCKKPILANGLLYMRGQGMCTCY